MRVRNLIVSGVLGALMLADGAAFAQSPLSGNWLPMRQHEDDMDRGPGPDLGDYTGLPINDAARLFAESWDASRLTLQEHQCRVHVAPYIYHGPLNLRIWEEKDPEDAAGGGDQELRQHLRADAHDLAGRPAASLAVRAAHVHGLFDRQVGWPRADGGDHAPEAGLAASQRRSGKRPDHALRAVRAPRQLPDAHRDHHRPGVSGRADDPHHRLPAVRAGRGQLDCGPASTSRRSPAAPRARCRTICRGRTRSSRTTRRRPARRWPACTAARRRSIRNTRRS